LYVIIQVVMSQKGNAYDYLVKLLIIGDSGVGKTCILLRFCENSFQSSHLSTIGIDFKIKTIDVDSKKIKLQIWDTAGQERFKTITQTYYKGAMGIVLTYACNDRDSFNNIENWLRQIKQHANENVCKILVANKCDISDRTITFSEGKALADKYNMQFFETSAKTDTNITPVFGAIAKEIKDRILTNDTGRAQETGGGTSLKKDNSGGEVKKGSCCS